MKYAKATSKHMNTESSRQVEGIALPLAWPTNNRRLSIEITDAQCGYLSEMYTRNAYAQQTINYDE